MSCKIFLIGTMQKFLGGCWCEPLPKVWATNTWVRYAPRWSVVCLSSACTRSSGVVSHKCLLTLDTAFGQKHFVTSIRGWLTSKGKEMGSRGSFFSCEIAQFWLRNIQQSHKRLGLGSWNQNEKFDRHNKCNPQYTPHSGTAVWRKTLGYCWLFFWLRDVEVFSHQGFLRWFVALCLLLWPTQEKFCTGAVGQHSKLSGGVFQWP